MTHHNGHHYTPRGHIIARIHRGAPLPTYPDTAALQQARHNHSVAEREVEYRRSELEQAEDDMIEAAAELNTAHARYQEAAAAWHARMKDRANV